MFMSPDTPTGGPLLRIAVMQGQVRVGKGQPVILTTILGSCIACCMYDPIARIGGMNHFLLAEPHAGQGIEADEHYGIYLMELLINQMMTGGAVKSRIKAHIYGGGNMHMGLNRIGDANALFAESFLADEGIPLVRKDVGGEIVRRVDFDPLMGRVRCKAVDAAAAAAIRAVPRPRRGDVELF